MAKLNFQKPFSSLQCQKSFLYAHFVPFLLLSMLKKVVLLNIYVETVRHVYPHDVFLNEKFKRTVFI